MALSTLFVVGFGAGCGDSFAEPDGGPIATPLECGAEPCEFVISALRPPRMHTEGRVIGVDLDDHVSDESSPQSCGHADFVAPDGTMGVDNEFVRLVPTLEGATGTALEDARDTTIADGTFLFGMAFEDRELDSGSSVAVRAGEVALTEGTEPQLDGSGGLVPAQPFGWQGDPTDGEGAVIEGILDASVGDLRVMWAFDEMTTFDLPVRDARVIVPLTDGEPGTGLLVGRIAIDDLLATIIIDGPDPEAPRMMLEAVADLDPNAEGVCQSISIAVEVELVRARIEP